MSKTIQELLQSSNNIDRLDAELLIAHVLGKSREFVLSHPEQTIDKIHGIKYKRLTKKRARGIPLAYLIKHREFFGLDFFVNKHVLVPRPETELMVTLALEHLSTKAHDKTILIDVGTGSGCIPIAIAKTIRKSGLSGYPNNIIAIDISRRALHVARKNATRHGVEINFLYGNLLSPIIKNVICYLPSDNCQIIITANLPYITEEQFQSEPSIHHEPKLALIAENQGLALYEELLKQIQSLLLTLDFRLLTYLEIDPSQSTTIKPLIKKYLPNAKIEIKQDLAGLDRIVVIESK